MAATAGKSRSKIDFAAAISETVNPILAESEETTVKEEVKAKDEVKTETKADNIEAFVEKNEEVDKTTEEVKESLEEQKKEKELPATESIPEVVSTEEYFGIKLRKERKKETKSVKKLITITPSLHDKVNDLLDNECAGESFNSLVNKLLEGLVLTIRNNNK